MTNNKAYKERFLFLHAIRGVAAMAVVFYHLYGNLKAEVTSWFPSVLSTILQHGYLGVPVFFVISGFVITHSVDCPNITPAYIGRFALRRALRLDPPYWAMIAITIVLMQFKNNFFGGHDILPSVKVTFAHLFYLQDLLGYNALSAVFWTLCLEVQLYLIYIILSGLSLYLAKKFLQLNFESFHTIILVSLGVYSFAAYIQLLPAGPAGLFIPFWHFFLLGHLAYKSIKNNDSTIFFIFTAYILCLSLVTSFNANVVAALISAIVFFIAYKSNYIYEGLGHSVFQYFGTISYSLYLSHADIGWKAVSFAKVYIFNNSARLNVFEFLFCLVSGLIVSIISAHFLYRLIELPSSRLSKSLKKNTAS